MRLSTDIVANKDKRDVWAEHIAPMFSIDPLTKNEHFRVQMDSYYLNGLVIAKADFTDQVFVRDQLLIAQSNLDHLLVHLYLAGGFHGRCGGQDLLIEAGDTFVFDMYSPLRTVAITSTTLGIMLPRALLQSNGLLQSEIRALKFSGRSPLGQLLAQHIQHLYTILPLLSVSQRVHVSQGSCALIASCIAAQLDQGRPRSSSQLLALRERAMAIINSQLDNPDLDPSLLCQILKVSRAHLYREFRNEGGIAELIRGKRLRQCLLALQQPSNSHLSISEIAYRHGFASETCFRRSFQQYYALSPSDVRKRQTMTPSDSKNRLAAWFSGNPT